MERWRRTSTLAVVLALVAAVLGVVPPAPARASCVGPVLDVGPEVAEDVERAGGDPAARVPEVVRAGDDLTVSGVWFHDGCDDTTADGGCSARSTQAPVRDVDLVLEQDGASWVLGTADAASERERYAVRWRVRVPEAAQPGPAVLRAGTAVVPVAVYQPAG